MTTFVYNTKIEMLRSVAEQGFTHSSAYHNAHTAQAQKRAILFTLA